MKTKTNIQAGVRYPGAYVEEASLPFISTKAVTK